jgi:hypothetical protein
MTGGATHLPELLRTVLVNVRNNGHILSHLLFDVFILVPVGVAIFMYLDYVFDDAFIAFAILALAFFGEVFSGTYHNLHTCLGDVMLSHFLLAHG